MNSHSLYQWNLAQGGYSGSGSLVPHVGTTPPSNSIQVSEDEVSRPKVSLYTLAQELLATLHRRGVARVPSTRELIQMILSRGTFRAHEIRDIIQLMYPAHYEGKVEYDRLVENVKHTLSRCHLFVKKSRTRGMAGKGGLWMYQPHAKPKARKNASRSRVRRSAAPSASIASPAHTDTTEVSQVEESFSVQLGPYVSSADASWVASPGADNHSFTYPVHVPETSSTPEWILFSENGQGALTGDDVASQQWMSFPSTPVTEFGQAGPIQNTTPPSFQYVPTMTPGSLHDADDWPQQMHPYSALPYGSPQFHS